MSIALMAEIWRLDLPTTDKMVLLALADAANDDGVTWMPVKSRRAGKMDLLTKCSLSERAVQGALRRLCEAGYLHRQDRPGKGSLWTVTPADAAPRSKCTPAANDKNPRSCCGENISNRNSPSEDKSSSGDAPARPDDFDRFWGEYPSKVAKLAARKGYAAAIKRLKARGVGDPHAVIMDGLARAKASARWADPTYTVPNPLTWLNQERWDDEHTPSRLQPAALPSAETDALMARHQALLTGTPPGKPPGKPNDAPPR